MLQAEKLKTYEPEKFFPGYASFKHNGVHGICDPKERIAYSRTPRVISGVQHIIKELKHLAYPMIGELIVPGVDFETCNGMVRDSYSHPEMEFRIFNCFVPRTPFRSKLEYMREIHHRYFLSHPTIKFVEFMVIEDRQSYDNFHEAAIEAGQEGTCLIHSEHVYQPGKRTWKWLKRVPDKSLEAEIIEVLPGTKGKKYENSLGAFRCRMDNGLVFKCGIFKGQTDEWRQDVYNNKEDWIGERITVIFKDYTKYGKPAQPRYKSVRWDLG